MLARSASALKKKQVIAVRGDAARKWLLEHKGLKLFEGNTLLFGLESMRFDNSGTHSKWLLKRTKKILSAENLAKCTSVNDPIVTALGY